jgi:Tol biopolymer transport system component
VNGPERLVLASDSDKNPLDWARDGSAIYYNLERPQGGFEIWMLPLTGKDRSPRVFLRAAETRDWLSVSPDSRWALYRAGRGPGRHVLLRPLLSAFGEWPIGGTGTSEGHWRADGRQIYFISGDTMMAQDVDLGASQARLGTPTSLFKVPPYNAIGRNAFVVTGDGKRFLIRTGQ